MHQQTEKHWWGQKKLCLVLRGVINKTGSQKAQYRVKKKKSKFMNPKKKKKPVVINLI